MMVSKMIFLFNQVILRFHVNLPGCKVPGPLGYLRDCTNHLCGEFLNKTITRIPIKHP